MADLFYFIFIFIVLLLHLFKCMKSIFRHGEIDLYRQNNNVVSGVKYSHGVTSKYEGRTTKTRILFNMQRLVCIFVDIQMLQYMYNKRRPNDWNCPISIIMVMFPKSI